MPNLTPFSSLNELARSDPWRNMEDFFRGLRARTWPKDPDAMAEFPLEVSEDEKTYTVKADLPGVAREDIQVSIEGNRVSISAEVKRESEEKDKNRNLLCTERYYGKQYRAFTLDSEVDDSKASANYRDGVLVLSLPKKAGSGTRKITIN